jgi:hypothetical protein
VNCDRSRQLLALDVSDDSPARDAEELRLHLETCQNCTDFFEQLDRNHSLLRTLRREAVPSSALAEMRQSLFARLEGEAANPGWGIRLERFLFGEIRKPRYAVLCIALLAIVSASVFAQLRHNSVSADAAIDRGRTLSFPADFRDWTLVGTSMQFSHSGNNLPQRIYVNPEGYREFRRSGHFPEGTVLVLESAGAVAASVKDHRFTDGWGYFEFSGKNRQAGVGREALPVTAGCIACHRDRGATDHVFTQFYPVLRAALGVL